MIDMTEVISSLSPDLMAVFAIGRANREVRS